MLVSLTALAERLTKSHTFRLHQSSLRNIRGFVDQGFAEIRPSVFVVCGGLPEEMLRSGEARWLGIQPEREPELPRVLLVSAPYALKAADAETLGRTLQLELLSMVQWETGSGCVRGAVSVKTCLAEEGSSCMWLRNVTVCQICCTVKTFFQPGMAVQRMPCSRM